MKYNTVEPRPVKLPLIHPRRYAKAALSRTNNRRRDRRYPRTSTELRPRQGGQRRRMTSRSRRPCERSRQARTAIVPCRGGRRRQLQSRVPTPSVPRVSGAADWSVGTFEGGIRRQRRKNNKNEKREDLTYSRHVWCGASPTTSVVAPARTPPRRLTPGRQRSNPPPSRHPPPDDAYLHPRECRAIVDRWLRGGSETRSPSPSLFHPRGCLFLSRFNPCNRATPLRERGGTDRCLESDAPCNCGMQPLKKCSLKRGSVPGTCFA